MIISDTITAPITNITTQAVAVIRISGDEAFEIINKITNKKVDFKRGIYFRQILSNNELIDEVIITAFIGPNSFTGENVIEIACHGGILNTNRILQLMISNGARLALKGEFSQRAFVNGKIDLIQAEGINDLIHAPNELALKIGVQNMSGKNNKIIDEFKADLMDIISRIQVSIDYPDYDDVEGSSKEELLVASKNIYEKISNLLFRSKMAFKSIDGIKTAIVGQTNVGKSSLLNSLLNEDKAIVTNIEGTTRDIVEGQISLGGTTLNLVDTAGIRKTKDVVENIGIEKSKEYINKSDLILFVVDLNQINDDKNREIFKLLENKTFILVVNKKELLSEKQIEDISKNYENIVFISAINNEINPLIEKIQEMYENEEIINSNELILININQISLLEKIVSKINDAINSFKQNFPIDIVNVDLYEAWDCLNNLIGNEYDEEIIDNIFRKYCLGK